MSREELFDLAVERADTFADRLGLARDDPEALQHGLELWYLRTRFAYRVPLEDVVAALVERPSGHGRSVWRGGRGGGWLG